MKKLLIVALLGLSALSYAPIGEKPADKDYYKESDNAALAEQQREQFYTDADGNVPRTHQDLPTMTEEPDGANALTAAAAVDALEKGAENSEKEESGGWVRPLVLGGVFLALGMGVVQLVRFYADRAVPKKRTRKPMSW